MNQRRFSIITPCKAISCFLFLNAITEFRINLQLGIAYSELSWDFGDTVVFQVHIRHFQCGVLGCLYFYLIIFPVYILKACANVFCFHAAAFDGKIAGDKSLVAAALCNYVRVVLDRRYIRNINGSAF